MLKYLLIANSAGNVLLERFHAVPLEERAQLRAHLVKLGAEARDEQHCVAVIRQDFVVYCAVQDIIIYVVGNKEYDDLGLSEVLAAVVASLKDLCRSNLREVHLLDRYGRACLMLDEIWAQGIFEHTDKDRIRRLTRLKPMPDF